MRKTNIHKKNKNKLFVASLGVVVAIALIASHLIAMDNDAFATTRKNKGGSVTYLRNRYLNHNLQYKTPHVLPVVQRF
jgi:hypothetical protein